MKSRLHDITAFRRGDTNQERGIDEQDDKNPTSRRNVIRDYSCRATVAFP